MLQTIRNINRVKDIKELPPNTEQFTNGYAHNFLFPLHPHTKSVAIFEAPFWSEWNSDFEYMQVRLIQIYRGYRIEFYTSESEFSRWWNSKKFEDKQDAIAYGLDIMMACQSGRYEPCKMCLPEEFLICTTDAENNNSWCFADFEVEVHSFFYENWFLYQDLENDPPDNWHDIEFYAMGNSAKYQLFDPVTNTMHCRTGFICATDFVWEVENKRLNNNGQLSLFS